MNKKKEKKKHTTKFVPGKNCSAATTALCKELAVLLGENLEKIVKINARRGDRDAAYDGVQELACKLLGAPTGYGSVLQFQDEEQFLDNVGKMCKEERIFWLANQARPRQTFTYEKARDFYDADVMGGDIQDDAALVDDDEGDPRAEAFAEGFNRAEERAEEGECGPSAEINSPEGEDEGHYCGATNDTDGEAAVHAKEREAEKKRRARALKRKRDKVRRILGVLAFEADRHASNHNPRPGDEYDRKVRALAAMYTLEAIHDRGVSRRDIKIIKEIVVGRRDRGEVAREYGVKTKNAFSQAVHRVVKKLGLEGPEIFRKACLEIFHDMNAA